MKHQRRSSFVIKVAMAGARIVDGEQAKKEQMGKPIIYSQSIATVRMYICTKRPVVKEEIENCRFCCEFNTITQTTVSGRIRRYALSPPSRDNTADSVSIW